MCVSDRLDAQPRIYYVDSQLIGALNAQLVYFSFVWIANFAKVLEFQVNNEVVRYYFTFILTHIFRRKLHLARVDVVSILNKRRVEHYSEQSLICKAYMPKNYLSIPSHRKTFLLFLAELYVYLVLAFVVECLRRVAKNLVDFQTVAVVDIERGLAAA